MAHLYEVGTKAWQPDPTEGWVASELVSKTNDGDKYTLIFNLENGDVSLLSSLRTIARRITHTADANSVLAARRPRRLRPHLRPSRWPTTQICLP
jgi:myosin-5